MLFSLEFYHIFPPILSKKNNPNKDIFLTLILLNLQSNINIR